MPFKITTPPVTPEEIAETFGFTPERVQWLEELARELRAKRQNAIAGEEDAPDTHDVRCVPPAA